MESFDKQFTQLLKNGDDRAAFGLLYDQYWEKLFLFVVKVLRDRDDAIDIVQETFIALWEQRIQLDDVTSLRAYLFAIARYKTMQYIRRYARHDDNLESLTAFLSRHEQNPEELMMQTELQKQIDEQVQQFPAKMRTVFMLSRQENLSHREIAAKLNISDKTVKKQISNSLKLLRLKINDQYFSLLSILLLKFF